MNCNICIGQFYGGEIEPGTFHGAEIRPDSILLYLPVEPDDPEPTEG